MAWRLRSDYDFTDKKGRRRHGVTYHEGWFFGCPLGTSRKSDAKSFRTKGDAHAYQRDKLKGRGYRPERID